MEQLFRERKPERLAKGDQPTIIGDVFIHSTAEVHETAVVIHKILNIGCS